MGPEDTRRALPWPCTPHHCQDPEDPGSRYSDLKGYRQDVKYYNEKPPDHPADRTDEHSKRIDGYGRRENQVRYEQQNHPDERVDSKSSQGDPALHKQEHQNHYHDYEQDQLHETLLTPSAALLIQRPG